MVLVGKVNKDIVLRLNRHGQPAVGLCGDDGSLFRVARQTRAGRRGHRLRRPDRAGRRRRPAAHRAGLHPGRRLGRRRPRGQLLQRQRRRGRRAPSPARCAPTRSCSSPTSPAGCAIRPTPSRSSPRRTPTRSTEALAGHRRRHAPEAAGLPRRDPRRRDATRTSSTAASRTPCSWSCSRTPAWERRSGRPHEHGGLRHPPRHLLRALPGRVRPGRGHAAVGQRGQRVPRLPLRDLRLERRPLPSGGRRRDPGAVGEAPPRRQPLLHRADGAAGRPPGAELARRARVLHELRRGGRRGGAQARAQGQARRGHRRRRTARSTAAPSAR